MSFLRKSSLVLAGLFAVIGTADASRYRERQDAELMMFEQYAQEPVDRIRTFFGVDRWQSLGPDKLVVWTSVNRAWLLTLTAPCSGIEFQHTIGISSTNSTIHRRFDKVQFEHQSCFIDEIRPVDYKTLKRERRERNEAKRR